MRSQKLGQAVKCRLAQIERPLPIGLSFGRNANQEYHVWRHVVDELSLSRQRVQDAVVAVSHLLVISPADLTTGL